MFLFNMFLALPNLLQCHEVVVLNTQSAVNVSAVQAEAVVNMIGFPEFIRNATKLDERYEEVCRFLCLLFR